MIQLSREIRFALVSPEELAAQPKPTNSWASWPSTNRIVPHLVLRAVVEGNPDPVTGYLCNIKIIDDILREVVTTDIIPTLGLQEVDLLPAAETLLQTVFTKVATLKIDQAQLISVSLSLSPYLSASIHSESRNMIKLTQQFEFSAAHRLHCDSLSAEENKAMFGKCNNPAGHGHNYVVEVTIERDEESVSSPSPTHSLIEFENVVKTEIIDRLDHKHLNKDIEHFSKINPSVENISIAIWNWLAEPISQLEKLEANLVSVKVFETPKTWATYSGPSGAT